MIHQLDASCAGLLSQCACVLLVLLSQDAAEVLGRLGLGGMMQGESSPNFERSNWDGKVGLILHQHRQKTPEMLVL